MRERKPTWLRDGKYFSRSDGFFFEKLVQTADSNRWATQHIPARSRRRHLCTDLRGFGVDVKLLPDLDTQIQLTVRTAVVVGVTVTGHRGERVEIRCSYKSGYESNSKYFCKGECKYVPNKNIKVKSGSPAKDERFSLTDDTTNRVFTVTITDLRTEDEGQYWCAVKRILLFTDVYSEILLKVKQGPLTQTPSPDTGSFGIIIAGVLVLFLIGAVLLVVVVRKKKQTCGPVSFFTEEIHPTLKKGEENEYDEGNSHTAQSEFHRPVNTEPVDTDLDYTNITSAATHSENLDQIYTALDASRQSNIYQCLASDSAQEESIYHNIDQMTD